MVGHAHPTILEQPFISHPSLREGRGTHALREWLIGPKPRPAHFFNGQSDSSPFTVDELVSQAGGLGEAVSHRAFQGDFDGGVE